MPQLAVAALVASTAVSAAGTIASGNAARAAATNQAAQLNQQAGQERAASQRIAIQKRRDATLANSRVQAVSAASGGSATDSTIDNITQNIAGQGEFNALTALYNGEERSRGLEMSASNAMLEGKQAHRSAVFSAGGTILNTASSLFSRYGNGGPDTTAQKPFYGPSNLPWQNTPGYKLPTYG